VYPRDVYETLQFYGTGDTVLDRDVMRRLRALRNRPDASVSIYRAVPPRARVIHSGDWVTPVLQYAENHALATGNTRILTAVVPAAALFTDGNSLLEWGYFAL
jgi:hypothetical protein